MIHKAVELYPHILVALWQIELYLLFLWGLHIEKSCCIACCIMHLCRLKGIILHVPVDLLLYNKVGQRYDNGQYQTGQFLCRDTFAINAC